MVWVHSYIAETQSLDQSILTLAHEKKVVEYSKLSSKKRSTIVRAYNVSVCTQVLFVYITYPSRQAFKWSYGARSCVIYFVIVYRHLVAVASSV